MTGDPKAPSPIDVHVGKRIRLRRVSVGLSQTDLGNALGLSFQQVQKYEKGINRIGAARLSHIAQLLNTSIDYFFQGLPGSSPISVRTQDPEMIDMLVQLLDTKEGRALVEGFILIEDPSARQVVVDLVKHLSKASGHLAN